MLILNWFQRKKKIKDVFHHPNGQVSMEIWYDKKGYIHREQGPAVILYDEKGNIIHQIEAKHGLIDDNTSVYLDNGIVIIEVYNSNTLVRKEYFDPQNFQSTPRELRLYKPKFSLLSFD